jgi:hypothetical protein
MLQKKKKLNNDNSSEINSYELDFSKIDGVNCVVIDLDYEVKTKQKDQFNRININDFLISMCVKYGLYCEKTLNGGFHIFVRLSDTNLVECYSRLVLSNKFVIEILRKCVVFPSYMYDIIYQDTNVLQLIDYTAFLEIFDNVVKFLDKDHKPYDIPIKIISNLGSFLFEDISNSNDSHTIDNNEMIELNSQSNQGLNLENGVNSINSVDESNSTLRKNVSNKDFNIVINQLNDDNKEWYKIFEGYVPICMLIKLKDMILLRNFQDNSNKQKNYDILNGTLNSFAFIVKTFACQSEIFLNSIVNFLYFYNSRSINNNSNSPFSVLKDTNLWLKWSQHFCRVMKVYILRDYKIGQLGVKKLTIEDSYKIYRYFTLINSVGMCLDENDAFIEYMTIYNNTHISLTNWKMDLISLFIATLLYCRFEIYEFYVFESYTNFLRGSLSKNLSCRNSALSNLVAIRGSADYLTFTKPCAENILTNLSGNFLEQVTDLEDSNIYFKLPGCKWGPVNSSEFSDLLKKYLCEFSDNDIIKFISSYLPQNSNKIPLKHSDNQLPFIDGVLDLRNLTFKPYNEMHLNTECVERKFLDFKYIKSTEIFNLDSNRYLTFAPYVKSLFGQDVINGTMEPYNYFNFHVLMLRICGQLLTRTRCFQEHIVLQGKCGGNGKTEFIEFLSRLFLNLTKSINLSAIKSHAEVNTQVQNLSECLFVTVQECEDVESLIWKGWTDVTENIFRTLYKDMKREKLRFGLIIATNIGINFNTQMNYDVAILRRYFNIQLSNKFTDCNLEAKSPVYVNMVKEKNSKTITPMQTGCLRYIIDMFRYYGICNMSQDDINSIKCPLANKRKLIAYNHYNFFGKLYDYGIPIDELFSKQEMDQDQNIMSHVSSLNLKKIFSNESVTLQILADKAHVGIEVTQTEMNENIIENILTKNNISSLEMERYNFPGKKFFEIIKPNNDEEWSSEKKIDFMMDTIPLAQQFIVNKKNSLGLKLMEAVYSMWIKKEINCEERDLSIDLACL